MKSIPSLCVAIGTIAAQKSAFFCALEFLQDSFIGNVNTALANLGGMTAGKRSYRNHEKSGGMQKSPLLAYTVKINGFHGEENKF